jgi:hypothetical protein
MARLNMRQRQTPPIPARARVSRINPNFGPLRIRHPEVEHARQPPPLVRRIFVITVQLLDADLTDLQRQIVGLLGVPDLPIAQSAE